MLFERIKLEDDERVLRVVRKHWWIIFTRTVTTVFSAAFPLVLFATLLQTELVADPLREALTQSTNLVVFAYLTWVLMHWMILANFWTDYYLDLWAITNRRIVAIDQRGFFNRFLSSFRLERLQDMNIEVQGVIPTLLNYGAIEAQTAGGSNEEFKAFNMPDPRGLKALIIRSADERQAAVGMRGIANDGTL